MVDEGLLKNVPYEEPPPRYEYRLTDKGARILGRARPRCGDGAAIGCGAGWSASYLVDHETGREVRPLVVDENTGNRLTGRRLRMSRKPRVSPEPL